MKRVFVFQDFKSQKFWSIEVVGTDVTVNYGKLGTAGQTQVKNYATTEEAEKAANKLIAEKTKKGYVETAEETAREMKVEAKKYTLSYDEYENDVKLLDKILKDKHLSEYKQITIGCWDYEGDDCSALLQGLIENKDKFAQIEIKVSKCIIKKYSTFKNFSVIILIWQIRQRCLYMAVFLI